jgi:hypothetical protein
MSTVAEINETIHRLSDDELRAVEREVIQEYRKRKIGIIFDDSYGAFTEEDLRAVQEQTFRVLDGEPPKP